MTNEREFPAPRSYVLEEPGASAHCRRCRRNMTVSIWVSSRLLRNGREHPNAGETFGEDQEQDVGEDMPISAD